MAAPDDDRLSISALATTTTAAATLTPIWIFVAARAWDRRARNRRQQYGCRDQQRAQHDDRVARFYVGHGPGDQFNSRRGPPNVRSEERRVGKECRSRG